MKKVMTTFSEQCAMQKLLKVIKGEVESGFISDTDTVELDLSVLKTFQKYFDDKEKKVLDLEEIKKEFKQKRVCMTTQPYRINLQYTDSLVDASLKAFCERMRILNYNELIRLEDFLVYITTEINKKINERRAIYNGHIKQLEISKLDHDLDVIIETRTKLLAKDFEQLSVLEAYRDAFIEMQIQTVVRKGDFIDYNTHTSIPQI